MKKYILLSMLFAFAMLFSSAQEKPTPVKLADDVKETLSNSQCTTDVNTTAVYLTEKLEVFAKSLKTPIEHVYKVLVKQQIINSYLFLSVGVLSFVLLIFVGIFISKAIWGNIHKYDNDDPKSIYWKGKAWNKYATFTIISAFLFLCAFIPFVCNLKDIFTGFNNPEYGALMQIMEIFK